MRMALDSALRQAAAATFERLGFLFAEGELNEAQEAAPWGSTAHVRFQGRLRGRLEVQISGNLMDELAANMLGVLPPVARAVQRDALGEVANVICGNVLPALAGAEVVYDLEPPRIREACESRLAHAEDGEAGLQAEALMGLGAGRARVRLEIEGRSAPEV